MDALYQNLEAVRQGIIYRVGQKTNP